MPGVDFWVQWHLAASMDDLRATLPTIARELGVSCVETVGMVTGPDWGSFAVVRDADGGRIGVARAQTLGDGSEIIISPGPARDAPDLHDLNRFAVLVYLRAVARGWIAPPAPLETPRAGIPVDAPLA